MNYYSQHGEDAILYELLKKQQKGYFVEVGCIDGIRFSNTYIFEELGWDGLCVEAHPDYYKLLKQRKCDSYHAVVSEKDQDEIMFYANSRGTFSTISKERYNDFIKGPASPSSYKKIKVPSLSLTTIFNEKKIPSDIDILSIDIEGSELDALKGLDFNIYKPKIMVLEVHNNKYTLEMKEYLENKSYHLVLRIKNNVFFTLDEHIIQNIKNKILDINLIHTAHPLDKKQNVNQKVIINCNRYIQRKDVK